VQFAVDTLTEPIEEREPTTILRVLAASLEHTDWAFSGRSETSRRTPTAGILMSGKLKLLENYVYIDPEYEEKWRRLRDRQKAGRSREYTESEMESIETVVRQAQE
jgi:hypothetical protein